MLFPRNRTAVLIPPLLRPFAQNFAQICHHDDTTSEPLIQPISENSILEGRMENSSTTCEVQTEGENSQIEMPTDVTCGENSRKEQMQVSGILSEPNEEEVQLLHAIDILIPNQSVTSWSDDEDACRNNHSTMLQETSQGGVSNGTEQITPSEVVTLMAGSCAAVGTRNQIDESTGMFDPVTALGLKSNADEKYQIIRIGPCHLSKADIKTKQCGDRRRRCSEKIFSHSDGTKRKWIFYSTLTLKMHCFAFLACFSLMKH